ncbi:Glutamate decarboxylase 1 [Hordeum vulgare]|nr:Glutamate decarboxylase 1 [Hordeum vulgare]
MENHVIIFLVRKYFPELAKPNDDDTLSPGFTWEQYQHTKDEDDVTMAARVINGFREAFSCVDGEKEKATKALVNQPRRYSNVKHTLQYEAVMQCQLLDDNGDKMTRKIVCQTNLDKEEYLWVLSGTIGGGSLLPVHILEAWKESRKGKDGSELCSHLAQERYETFREVFQEEHGKDAEPTSKPLDPELLIIADEGKGHVRHLLCNGAIATSLHHKLHEIRTSSTSSTLSIPSRSTVAAREITRLKELLGQRAAEEEQSTQVEEQRR